MAARGTAQRPNGAVQGKICQFKLVLLGECRGKLSFKSVFMLRWYVVLGVLVLKNT